MQIFSFIEAVDFCRWIDCCCCNSSATDDDPLQPPSSSSMKTSRSTRAVSQFGGLFLWCPSFDLLFFFLDHTLACLSHSFFNVLREREAQRRRRWMKAKRSKSSSLLPMCMCGTLTRPLTSESEAFEGIFFANSARNSIPFQSCYTHTTWGDSQNSIIALLILAKFFKYWEYTSN